MLHFSSFCCFPQNSHNIQRILHLRPVFGSFLLGQGVGWNLPMHRGEGLLDRSSALQDLRRVDRNLSRMARCARWPISYQFRTLTRSNCVVTTYNHVSVFLPQLGVYTRYDVCIQIFPWGRRESPRLGTSVPTSADHWLIIRDPIHDAMAQANPSMGLLGCSGGLHRSSGGQVTQRWAWNFVLDGSLVDLGSSRKSPVEHVFLRVSYGVLRFNYLLSQIWDWLKVTDTQECMVPFLHSKFLAMNSGQNHHFWANLLLILDIPIYPLYPPLQVRQYCPWLIISIFWGKLHQFGLIPQYLYIYQYPMNILLIIIGSIIPICFRLQSLSSQVNYGGVQLGRSHEVLYDDLTRYGNVLNCRCMQAQYIHYNAHTDILYVYDVYVYVKYAYVYVYIWYPPCTYQIVILIAICSLF